MPEEALRLRQEEQLPVFELLGDIRFQAITFGRIADILHAQGQLRKALRMLQEEVLPPLGKLGTKRSERSPSATKNRGDYCGP